MQARALNRELDTMDPARLFSRPHYTSDTTDFLAELQQQRSTLEQEQRAGRARLWDMYIDPDLEREFAAARVPMKGYVYYQNDV